MHDTPEQIAARLTKAQRRAILWLPKDVGFARLANGRNTTTLWAISDRRLAQTITFDWWQLTPLGAAVRAVVAKEDGDADPR